MARGILGQGYSRVKGYSMDMGFRRLGAFLRARCIPGLRVF